MMYEVDTMYARETGWPRIQWLRLRRTSSLRIAKTVADAAPCRATVSATLSSEILHDNGKAPGNWEDIPARAPQTFEGRHYRVTGTVRTRRKEGWGYFNVICIAFEDDAQPATLSLPAGEFIKRQRRYARQHKEAV